MKHFKFLTGLMLVCVVSAGPAQQAEIETQSPREQVVREFDRKAPKVGQPIPDLNLLDARGKPFSTSDLRGSYAVLVFGCLT